MPRPTLEDYPPHVAAQIQRKLNQQNACILRQNPQRLPQKATEWPVEPPSTNKYGAQKCVIDGLGFDSKTEGKRWTQLRAMQAAGSICNLEVQPVFEIVINGVACGTYSADFRYRWVGGDVVIEDVKSAATRTQLYRFKKRVVEAMHGVVIEEWPKKGKK